MGEVVRSLGVHRPRRFLDFGAPHQLLVRQFFLIVAVIGVARQVDSRFVYNFGLLLLVRNVVVLH